MVCGSRMEGLRGIGMKTLYWYVSDILMVTQRLGSQ